MCHRGALLLTHGEVAPLFPELQVHPGYLGSRHQGGAWELRTQASGSRPCSPTWLLVTWAPAQPVGPFGGGRRVSVNTAPWEARSSAAHDRMSGVPLHITGESALSAPHVASWDADDTSGRGYK